MSSLEGTRLWRLLEALVAEDTVPTAPTAGAAAVLAERLEAAGWTVEAVRHRSLGAEKTQLVAWAGPPEPGGLALSGHLDVVPWAGQPGWTRDPLRLALDGGRLFGRGVADMKGFVAAAVDACLEVDPGALRRPLVLILTADEEIGCQGAARLVPRLRGLVGVPMPPEVLIGEPTGGQVFRAHKGHVRVTAEVRGRAAHSSRPDLGASAIAAAARAVTAVDGLAAAARREAGMPGLFPDFPWRPYNVGTIRGGTAVNTVAERCTLEIGFRPLPGEDPETLLRELEREVSEAACEVEGAGVAFLDRVITPPMLSPEDGRLPRELARLAAARPAGGAPYATDGGQLAAAGLAGYLWGPGELEAAHRPDEWLDAGAFLACRDTLLELIRTWCG